MLEITVKDKYLDILSTKSGKKKFAFLVILALAITVLSYFLYYNVLTVVTVGLACMVFVYAIMTPPRKIKLKIDEDKFEFEGKQTDLSKLDSWAIIDLGEVNEIIIKKSGIRPEFISFYMSNEEEPQIKDLVAQLTKTLPYNPQTGRIGIGHVIYRTLGIK